MTSVWQSHWILLAVAGAGCGLVFTFSALAVQALLERRRLDRFHELELVPNILMTRYPVLFIGRNRSLFRLSGDFLELPIYLKEHGYQVEEVELNIRGLSEEAILANLSALLSSPLNGSKIHLFLPQQFVDAAYDLAFSGHPNLASLTVIGTSRSALQMERIHLRPPRVPLHLRPDLKPQIAKFDFQTERSTLDHLVSLAESDLR